MTSVPLVWVVDDDPDDQLIMAMAISQIAPAVRVNYFKDGLDVLTHLSQRPLYPRLIILDLNMPGKNGFETLNEIRNMPATHQLPVIIFTTSTHQQDRDRSILLGANAFYSKPGDYDQILLIMKEIADKWQLSGTAH
ncbi:response regulator receiver protein [Fibrisoma limi BUZ 3]|uniref:Response regulator receiver protein n=1 Tax=Fibrisoma limi BUZ 3 TaxID=1185876 RepID=I2GG49_9BACT|nr:response regulator [Fibrisoma limi]CCH52874.1 response regulator receiver protein [Fibrisoma limi BUZ 3]